MRDPEVDALSRETRRKRRLPPDALCEDCGTTKHLKAFPDGRVLCYGCIRAEAGASGVEEDHLAGWVNLGGVKVRLWANNHRTVTECRARLGVDEWPDAEGDPLLILAHFLAGLGTLLVLLAEWLVELAADAAARLGPDRWVGAPLAPVAP